VVEQAEEEQVLAMEPVVVEELEVIENLLEQHQVVIPFRL
tara:strand:+ start:59 stop:178 length:120 start_codon:yes stop_codon:yes gene_type:complete